MEKSTGSNTVVPNGSTSHVGITAEEAATSALIALAIAYIQPK